MDVMSVMFCVSWHDEPHTLLVLILALEVAKV